MYAVIAFPEHAESGFAEFWRSAHCELGPFETVRLTVSVNAVATRQLNAKGRPPLHALPLP